MVTTQINNTTCQYSTLFPDSPTCPLNIYDLLGEIGKRLPPRTLMICARVCNQWQETFGSFPLLSEEEKHHIPVVDPNANAAMQCEQSKQRARFLSERSLRSRIKLRISYCDKLFAHYCTYYVTQLQRDLTDAHSFHQALCHNSSVDLWPFGLSNNFSHDEINTNIELLRKKLIFFEGLSKLKPTEALDQLNQKRDVLENQLKTLSLSQEERDASNAELLRVTLIARSIQLLFFSKADLLVHRDNLVRQLNVLQVSCCRTSNYRESHLLWPLCADDNEINLVYELVSNLSNMKRRHIEELCFNLPSFKFLLNLNFARELVLEEKRSFADSDPALVKQWHRLNDELLLIGRSDFEREAGDEEMSVQGIFAETERAQAKEKILFSLFQKKGEEDGGVNYHSLPIISSETAQSLIKATLLPEEYGAFPPCFYRVDNGSVLAIYSYGPPTMNCGYLWLSNDLTYQIRQDGSKKQLRFSDIETIVSKIRTEWARRCEWAKKVNV